MAEPAGGRAVEVTDALAAARAELAAAERHLRRLDEQTADLAGELERFQGPWCREQAPCRFGASSETANASLHVDAPPAPGDGGCVRGRRRARRARSADRVGSLPITVDTSSARDGLLLRCRSTAPGGLCTNTGMHFGLTQVPVR